MCGNKQNVAEQWCSALPNNVAEPNVFCLGYIRIPKFVEAVALRSAVLNS